MTDAGTSDRWQAVVDLLGALAYGELTAFERLAVDSGLAPTIADKAVLAQMATKEFAHYERLVARLTVMGVDPEEAMAPFVEPLNAFHDSTSPSDWAEGLIKAYVGDSLAADFYREIATLLDDEDARALVLEVLADTGHAGFAVDRVRTAIEADPAIAGRLALWARRIVGEALTQSQRVAVQRDSLSHLIGGAEDLAEVTRMLARITERHGERMKALGLSG
ncbi:MAG TPA: ferritin-like fold-containing protein [Mycobacteriales bacterium]|nr:ferritin-like fold-containing protein [Mycobacteriales bacterium]